MRGIETDRQGEGFVRCAALKKTDCLIADDIGQVAFDAVVIFEIRIAKQIFIGVEHLIDCTLFDFDTEFSDETGTVSCLLQKLRITDIGKFTGNRWRSE